MFSMARRSEDPTMTAWWSHRELATTRPEGRPTRPVEDDPHAKVTTPAPDSTETLAALSGMPALTAPRTPIEMWDMIGEDPSPSSEMPTRIAEAPEDPHETEDGTLFMRAPHVSDVAPRASHMAPSLRAPVTAPAPPSPVSRRAVSIPPPSPLGIARPRTLLPPARPAFVRAYATPPAAPIASPMQMVPVSAWRARIAIGVVAGIAFGTALIAGLFYGGAIQAHREPAPLVTLTAEPAAAPPPPEETPTREPPALQATTETNAATIAVAPKPRLAAPPVASAPHGSVQVSFAVTAPQPEKKTAKQSEVDAMLEKLGEEQLAR
jgi:hypothetical protein